MDILKKWFEDNFIYVCLANCESEEDRKTFVEINKACKKHDISLKKFMEILTDVNWVVKND